MHVSRPEPGSSMCGMREYLSLGVEATAAILMRLCNDLLDTGPVRQEIDRWGGRGGGMLAAGVGGWGGAGQPAATVPHALLCLPLPLAYPALRPLLRCDALYPALRLCCDVMLCATVLCCAVMLCATVLCYDVMLCATVL